MGIISAIKQPILLMQHGKEQDTALVERITNGDRVALNELIHMHIDAMWKVALRFCDGRASDAEDVIQEVCLTCLRAANTYAQRGSVRSWILAITANAARDHYRKTKRRQQREVQDHDLIFTPIKELDDNPLSDAAIACLAELREPFRIILSLRYLDKFDDAAIATMLGLNEVTVRTRCHRGLNYLRSALNRRGLTVGATALIAALIPAHASAAPAGISQLISTTCMTGQVTSVGVSTMLGGSLPSLWIGGKTIAAMAVVGFLVASTVPFLLQDQPPIVHSEAKILDELPVIPEAVAAKDANIVVPSPILDQLVTVHFKDVAFLDALALLRISLPLDKRPQIILGSSTQFPDEIEEIDWTKIEPDIMGMTKIRQEISKFAETGEAEKFSASNNEPAKKPKKKNPITLSVEDRPLAETCTALCDAVGMRWWSDGKTILIDKPLSLIELNKLQQAFIETGDLDSALALGTANDALALRTLLVALADPSRSKIAARALVRWIKIRTPDYHYGAFNEPLSSRKDEYVRNLVTRFTGDAEVVAAVAAVAAGVKENLLPFPESLYLCGQLGLDGALEEGIKFAQAFESLTRRERHIVIAVLGWSGDSRAVPLLLDIINKNGSPAKHDYVACHAVRALAEINSVKASDALLALSEKFLFPSDDLIKQFKNRSNINIVLISLIYSLADCDDVRVKTIMERYTDKNRLRDFGIDKYIIHLWPLSLRGDSDSISRLMSIAQSEESNKKNDRYAKEAMMCLLDHEGTGINDFLYLQLKNNALRGLGQDVLNDYVTLRPQPAHFPMLKKIMVDETIPLLDKKNYNSSQLLAARALLVLDKEKAQQFLWDTFPPKTSHRFPAYCLALSGASERGDTLIFDLANDPDPRIRLIAIYSLANMGDRGRNRLVQLIADEDDEQVCKKAYRILNPFLFPNDKFDNPATTQLWQTWLNHRFPSIRATATIDILSKPDSLKSADYLTLFDTIFASPELRRYLVYRFENHLKLYARESNRWRKVIPLVSDVEKSEDRIYFWQEVESYFRGGLFYLPKLEAQEDVMLLLETAAQVAANDLDSQVRARAGWALGWALRCVDVQTYPNYAHLKTQLLVCAENEKDPQAKKNLQEVANAQPFKSEMEVQGDRAQFTWPKELDKKSSSADKVKPESADDF